MDYQKINSRMIYGLALQVFALNLVTYIIIAFLNTVFAIAQGIIPFFGLFGFIVMIYLGAVSFMVAHKTIINGETVAPGEAFAITPQSKTYFWQYLMVTGIPVVLAIIGVIMMVMSETFLFDPYTLALVLIAVVTGVYYVLMAFFGTSLVATAVGGDGMMMVSRGRETFFYSLSRLIVLPTLALASFFGAIYYWLLSDGGPTLEGLIAFFGDNPNDAIMTVLLLSVAGQLFVILFNMITAVIITKAFLLAEVRLALKGEPTEWGKQAFGMTEKARGVVYR